MSLQFTDRIALYNTLASAVGTLFVFIAVYAVVFLSSYNHLDSDISREADEVLGSIGKSGDTLVIGRLPEWEEREHQQMEANPTFLQVVDKTGRRRFHSANMQSDLLPTDTSLAQRKFFNSQTGNQAIRVGQFPIRNQGKRIIGYLSIGVSRQESAVVLKNLRTTLFVAFPFLLIVLYLVTSFAASQSIGPVNRLIKELGGIRDASIHRRLPLPDHKDEIHQLATAINELLQRIESGLQREKQFTSDASHELRTPLAAIRGTLEVLIRKTRQPIQYEDKIGQVISEIDRMHRILDHLLQLARLESPNVAIRLEQVELDPLLEDLRKKWNPSLEKKNMTLHLPQKVGGAILTDRSLLELILGNLLSNAIKYGPPEGNVSIAWDASGTCLMISDDGPGIPEEHQGRIFDRFYRTDESRSSQNEGAGLGLSIVKRLADLLRIRLEVKSLQNEGTSFLLFFPK